MLLLVLFGLFVIVTIVGIFKKDIEDKLFLVYSVLACLIVGYTIFGLFKVFYITLNDAINIAIAIALMIIPVLLKLKPNIKKWIKALLSVAQLAIFIVVVGVFIQNLFYAARPMNRTAIEEIARVSFPRCRTVHFYSRLAGWQDLSADQRVKLKGDKTVFYEKLDSLAGVDGSGWQKEKDGYSFNSWSVKDNTDFVNYLSIDVNVGEDKAYIHFGNI